MRILSRYVFLIAMLICSSRLFAYDESYKLKHCFLNARDALKSAQSVEDTAKLAAYASDSADYYELAINHYKLALKEAQNSIEQAETLNPEELKERDSMIGETTRKIKICQNRFADVTYRKYYDNALRDFTVAQKAEESARYYGSPVSQSDYYQLAIKNYELALKQAIRSSEEMEELSQREKYERERLIAECRERLETCQKRYANATIDSTLEELRGDAHKFVIAGFNYATANDKTNARASWNEANRIYSEALLYTSDRGAQEVIKSKMASVKKYLEYVNEW
ncbi:MAG: hypothetical protein V1727_06120 [Candidatus Omnitrophota bacterium]